MFDINAGPRYAPAGRSARRVARRPAALLVAFALVSGVGGPAPHLAAKTGDRCGHVAEQRHKMRRKLRAIGATKAEIRKVMRKCKRRKGIPYLHGDPGRHLTEESGHAVGRRCTTRTVTQYSWAAPTPMDQINPYTYRLMDLKWR